MTKIDFHILPTFQTEDVYHYVARLVQKAQGRSHKVLIALPDADQSQAVSKALWQFKPEAFIAHNDISEAHFPLQLSHTNECGEHHDVLINLCPKTPEYFSRFERVFEVVCQQPEWLKSSRDRYRYYQDHGYEIERHDLRDRV
jgi:DNA polymerase-3 subunit chi